MKKILFVMHTLGFGGAERSLLNLLYALPQQDFSVDLLLFQQKGGLLPQLPAFVNLLDTPYTLHRLYAPVRRLDKLGCVRLFGTAISRIRRKTPKQRAAFRWKHFYKKHLPPLDTTYDVAVAYGGSELMYYIHDCVHAAKRVVFIHNDYRTGRYSAADDLPYLLKSDAVASVSDACVAVLKDIFPQLQGRLHCVENITAADFIRQRATAFVPAEYADDMPTLLTVGRLSPQKGLHTAIEAASVLRDRGIAFRWFVVGEGALRKTLEVQIRQNRLEDRFILLGTRENPYPYIRHCTVLVQPSVYEGKSVVLDEAKMLGVPIVSTAYPTVSDQLCHLQSGYITDMSATALADGIAAVIQDSTLQRVLRTHLSELTFDNTAALAKYIDILDG